MSEWIEVSEEKFKEFCKQQCRHLKIDVCRIPEPSVAYYIDTRLEGKWPEIAVGRCVLNSSHDPTMQDEYYLREGDDSLSDKLLKCIPDTWMDPLLSGSKAVIPHHVETRPITHKDIEILLSALKERMRETVRAHKTN